MDYTKLARDHLESALAYGYITLIDGQSLPLTAPQILLTAKYVLKEGLLSDSDSASAALTLPTEMMHQLDPPLHLDLDSNLESETYED